MSEPLGKESHLGASDLARLDKPRRLDTLDFRLFVSFSLSVHSQKSLLNHSRPSHYLTQVASGWLLSYAHIFRHPAIRRKENMRGLRTRQTQRSRINPPLCKPLILQDDEKNLVKLHLATCVTYKLYDTSIANVCMLQKGVSTSCDPKRNMSGM